MKATNLFNSDDRAVSPVIGVILMVAITVILAAVIGTFVLGLGDSLGDNQPSAQLNVNVDYAANNTTIEHNGGDSIESDELTVIVSFDGDTYRSANAYDSRFSVGDQFVADLDNGDNTATALTSGNDIRIRVVHESSDSILLDRSFEATGDLTVDNDFPLN
ncbi:type IV pilin [Halorubrum sp. DTA46]|uniref:type IV pilin n=1 Tax=Halorubrum sp. DTA46 TaxID=3402162 RepID=UPI003AAF7BAB